MADKNLSKILDIILDFRDARNWKQFNNPKDMALSLVLESTEVLEHFQWKNGEEVEDYIRQNKSAISEELADVLYWVLLLSHDMDIDPLEALSEKMKKNELKYPLEKSKGKHKKYTEL